MSCQSCGTALTNHDLCTNCVEVKELKDRVGQLEAWFRKARGLQRGCWCQYDYRCSNCSLILEIKEFAEGVPG